MNSLPALKFCEAVIFSFMNVFIFYGYISVRSQNCLCLNKHFLLLLLLLNVCADFLHPYFKEYYTRGITKLITVITVAKLL